MSSPEHTPDPEALLESAACRKFANSTTPTEADARAFYGLEPSERYPRAFLDERFSAFTAAIHYARDQAPTTDRKRDYIGLAGTHLFLMRKYGAALAEKA